MKFEAWLSETRRDFHKHPELSHKEIRTTEKISEILEELGLKIKKGLIKKDGINVGLVGLLEGEEKGRTLALRADIDALPIDEKQRDGVDYISENKGVMHACGHDAHTTIMLGVAKHIVENRIKFKGNVKFIFQPADEVGTGAKEMIMKGVLDNPYVDRILACHVHPALNAGEVGIHKERAFALVDGIKFSLRGNGGHIADTRSLGDPILAQAYLVNLLSDLNAENVNKESFSIRISKINAGEKVNIMPNAVELYGTFRGFKTEVRDGVKARLYQICEDVRKSFGLEECELDYFEGCPACINERETSNFIRRISEHTVGVGNTKNLEPLFFGEDFAYFANERPSSIILLGCAHEKGVAQRAHTSTFDIDEKVLKIGVDIFSKAVLEYLKK